MPQKPLQERIRHAKRGGVAPAVKDSDLGRETGKSAHGAKKSRNIARFTQLEDRTVRRKAAPGTGRSRRKAIKDLRAAYRAENAASGGGRGRRVQPPEPHPRPVAKVEGRKKAPSQMNVKRKGGPRKRSRLHGG